MSASKGHGVERSPDLPRPAALPRMHRLTVFVPFQIYDRLRSSPGSYAAIKPSLHRSRS